MSGEATGYHAGNGADVFPGSGGPAFVPVILSGGSGSRLWPVSREKHPKPFMKLSDGESLLQKSFRRAAALENVAEIVTVTNREFYFLSEDEYRAVNESNLRTSYLLEPTGKNTAPAIACAASFICDAYGPDAVMLVMTADHLIQDQKAFSEAVFEAVSLARESRLVTFGVRPTYPATGYGYIEAAGNRVERFIEKPSLDVAKEYFSSGRHLWNSGMFCSRVDTMLAELREHAPEVYEPAMACLQESPPSERRDRTAVQVELSDRFNGVPDISIDYALMEKTSNLSVVGCDIGWTDVGCWHSMASLQEKDGHGNACFGETIFQETRDTFIYSEKRLVTAIGLDNLVIVDTDDALLVADRSKAQDVKKVYASLKKSGHESYQLHAKVHRPWGSYTILEEGPGFKVKQIVVRPGGELSLQMHHYRSEHWVVTSGSARVINGDVDMMLEANQSTYIPAGAKHRLTNPGDEEVVLIEVQTGEYLGEDDIIRFQDVYGRVDAISA